MPASPYAAPASSNSRARPSKFSDRAATVSKRFMKTYLSWEGTRCTETATLRAPRKDERSNRTSSLATDDPARSRHTLRQLDPGGSAGCSAINRALLLVRVVLALHEMVAVRRRLTAMRTLIRDTTNREVLH